MADLLFMKVAIDDHIGETFKDFYLFAWKEETLHEMLVYYTNNGIIPNRNRNHYVYPINNEHNDIYELIYGLTKTPFCSGCLGVRTEWTYFERTISKRYLGIATHFFVEPIKFSSCDGFPNKDIDVSRDIWMKFVR